MVILRILWSIFSESPRCFSHLIELYSTCIFFGKFLYGFIFLVPSRWRCSFATKFAAVCTKEKREMFHLKIWIWCRISNWKTFESNSIHSKASKEDYKHFNLYTVKRITNSIINSQWNKFKTMFPLDGGRLIRLNKDGTNGEIIQTKKPKITFGTSIVDDYQIKDVDPAIKQVTCEISTDDYGRVCFTFHFVFYFFYGFFMGKKSCRFWLKRKLDWSRAVVHPLLVC